MHRYARTNTFLLGLMSDEGCIETGNAVDRNLSLVKPLVSAHELESSRSSEASDTAREQALQLSRCF